MLSADKSLPFEEFSGVALRVQLEEVREGGNRLAIEHIGAGQNDSETANRIHRAG